MMHDYWKTKLTESDSELCKMVESMIGTKCEPKNGGDHYFLEIDYRKNADPFYILTIWDAVEKRAGNRLKELKDDPERQCLWARITFCN